MNVTSITDIYFTLKVTSQVRMPVFLIVMITFPDIVYEFVYLYV